MAGTTQIQESDSKCRQALTLRWDQVDLEVLEVASSVMQEFGIKYPDRVNFGLSGTSTQTVLGTGTPTQSTVTTTGAPPDVVQFPASNWSWYVANPVRFRESLKVEIQDICDSGPGADDLTSVAFWYQEEPHQTFTLPSFQERISASKAGEKK